MKVTKTVLPGVLIVEPRVFRDERGFFLETFNEMRYAQHNIPGKDLHFIQDNHSRSCKGVLRGLHFQVQQPQGKLVGVVTGRVFDVVADVCPDSPTYKKWIGIELSDENHRQLWIPPGYAHGFCVLSPVADFVYKCTDYYRPEDEGGVLWNDPELGVEWPIKRPLVAEKDLKWPCLAQAPQDGLPGPRP